MDSLEDVLHIRNHHRQYTIEIIVKITKKQLRRIIERIGGARRYSEIPAHPRDNLGKNIADVEFPIAVGYEGRSEIAYNQDELDDILDDITSRGAAYSLNSLEDMEPSDRPVGTAIEQFGESMKITKRQLRKIIKESVTADEQRKIELLWWSAQEDYETGATIHSNRDQAKMLISTFGIDPASLKIWTIVYPWGELYEPWTYFDTGDDDEAPGHTVADVKRIINHFNSNNQAQLSFTLDSESGFVELDTDIALDEDVAEAIAEEIPKSDFETL